MIDLEQAQEQVLREHERCKARGDLLLGKRKVSWIEYDEDALRRITERFEG